MACWVVPTVAAEFWGVSVDRVWDRVQDGSVGVRHENGFTFVDVAPGAEEFQPQAPEPPSPPPATFVSVERDLEVERVGPFADLDEGEEMESATLPTAEWDTVRQWVSYTRRAPLARAA